MIETLYDNEWLSLKVAVLPYRHKNNDFQFLVKSEVTPCWWSLDPVMSAVTGGYEGVNVVDDAVREMLEETGYTIEAKDLEPLGTCYASKSADTIYYLYCVDVSDKVYSEPLGDGSRLESESKCFWVSKYNTAYIKDAQFSTMVLRFLLWTELARNFQLS